MTNHPDLSGSGKDAVSPYGAPNGGPAYGATPAPAPAPYGAAPAAYGSAPAPYGGPAPYGAVGNPYGQPATSSTNGLAVASLICSIAGLVLGWFLTLFTLASIAGIITGHIALSQIKRTGVAGRGMAVTGLVLGYLAVAGIVLLWLLMLLYFGSAFGYGLFSS